MPLAVQRMEIARKKISVRGGFLVGVSVVSQASTQNQAVTRNTDIQQVDPKRTRVLDMTEGNTSGNVLLSESKL